MNKCKICNAKTKEVINFGKMPVANGFIKKPQKNEFVFTLKVVFCPTCYMVQLGETVPPEAMFHQNYQFFSSTSKSMGEHFKRQADYITSHTRNKKNRFIVEIGSNDGIMLQHIAKKNISHLGVEPSVNVANESKKLGVNVTNDFFNQQNALKIEAKYGRADIICGSNVICHIEGINSVFEGVRALLKDDGIFFFEEPYIYDIIKHNEFDQIYDEHIYYYSGLSVKNLATRHGLQLVDMIHQKTHGGSMRYYIKRGNDNRVSARVVKHIGLEKKARLHTFEGYNNFKKHVDQVVNDFVILLKKINNAGKTIAGYAATSKSTTFLNYAQVGPELIEYISDTTPTKIGLITPGTHIPVRSHEYFIKDNPDYTVLFAYNHKKEILAKEANYRKGGGKFIIYFPSVHIV